MREREEKLAMLREISRRGRSLDIIIANKSRLEVKKRIVILLQAFEDGEIQEWETMRQGLWFRLVIYFLLFANITICRF